MKNTWVPLDHAAKLLISGIKKTETQTFRITCELTESVDPILLQLATEFTLDHFPSYRFIMRKGVFWYYLEDSDKIPVWAREFIGKMCGLGFITGYEDNTIRPNNNVTRAEAVTLLYKML